MLLIILFLVIPLIEISLFIMVGDEIGMLPTLLLCVVTAVLGASLLRQQGLKTLLAARVQISAGALPLQEIFDGFCLAIAGATLITPGFFTDFVGFMLLMPPVRRLLWNYIPQFFDITTTDTRHENQHRNSAPYNQKTIDVEFERVEDDETT